jgi:hypothetical protein
VVHQVTAAQQRRRVHPLVSFVVPGPPQRGGRLAAASDAARSLAGQSQQTPATPALAGRPIVTLDGPGIQRPPGLAGSFAPRQSAPHAAPRAAQAATGGPRPGHLVATRAGRCNARRKAVLRRGKSLRQNLPQVQRQRRP